MVSSSPKLQYTSMQWNNKKGNFYLDNRHEGKKFTKLWHFLFFFWQNGCTKREIWWESWRKRHSRKQRRIFTKFFLKKEKRSFTMRNFFILIFFLKIFLYIHRDCSSLPSLYSTVLFFFNFLLKKHHDTHIVLLHKNTISTVSS